MLRRFTFLLADAYVLVVVWFMVGECGWVEIGSPLVRLAEMRKRDPISLLFRSRLTVWSVLCVVVEAGGCVEHDCCVDYVLDFQFGPVCFLFFYDVGRGGAVSSPVDAYLAVFYPVSGFDSHGVVYGMYESR